MIDPDTYLAQRFAAVANQLDDSDWLAVRRRARRVRRRWLALPLAAALAALLVSSAFALYREVVDFLAAEPAPERIVIDFGRMSARATIGFGPQVIPGEARIVLKAPLRGTVEPLYVAPTQEGGFCWRWARTGSCGRIHPEQRPLGVTWIESAEGAAQLSGHLLDPAITRLVLEYEDGERVEIPSVWVSPPIDAGFYVFEVPREKLGAGRRAAVLFALDRDGDEIARHAFRYSDPRWESGPDGLPRIADRTQKRTLFDFRDHRGERWTLAVAPAPGDRLCYAYDGGGGCLSPKFPARIDGMGVQGGGAVNVCCAIADGVVTVELGFEDGAQTALKPVDGFLLYVIPPQHYPRGHRLESIVWRDASGHEVARRSVATRQAGIYPCADEEKRELGYGQTICP
jgi:hypothetical protein